MNKMNRNIQANIIKKDAKLIPLNKHLDNIGYTKYLPSFTKEWKNIIYSYNKNILRNVPMNYYNINKIINSYFNLHFKNWQFIKDKYNVFRWKRRRYVNKIYASDADIKYTNDKAIITLYIINAEKERVYNKYRHLNKTIRKLFTSHFIKIYKNLPKKLNYLLTNNVKRNYIFVKSIFRKKTILKYKFNYLSKLTKLNYFYIKKIWAIIEKKYLIRRKLLQLRNNNLQAIATKENTQLMLRKKRKLPKKSIQRYLLLLRRYELLYTLNQAKFSQSKYLPILSKYLTQIIGKKIEYNFIKLKSFSHNTDIMTNFVALKVKKRKDVQFYNSMSPVLNSPIIPKEDNPILAKTPIAKNENIDPYFQKFKDLKITSNLGSYTQNSVDTLLNNAYSSNKNVYTTIYDSIKYKNIGGIKLELSGRLTKRYRADRAKHFVRKRGGFRNNSSSYKQWSNILLKGNTIANQSYSWNSSKRRIGSFAVKGWIVGK